MTTQFSERTKEPPQLVVSSDGTDIFLILDGKRIAKRGRPNTQYAKQWIALEPGVVVRQRSPSAQIIVEINGVLTKLRP
jgi:hypothetical protein